MQRQRAEKGKPEIKQSAGRNFRLKDPMVENGILGDALFVTSISTIGVLLKPKEAKAEKAEISIPAKEEINNATVKSTASNPLFGIAMVVVAIGIYCKYKLFGNYDSNNTKSFT